MPTGRAYDPNDPVQNSFLDAVRFGENPAGDPFLGVGGTHLDNAPVGDYGFPQWQGRGNSHAAGLYQFQPGTWSIVAREYGLDFRNPQDQTAGAWYNAQRVYSARTGRDLETALQAGDYQSVQSALAQEWTSIPGTAATGGHGLAYNLERGIGATPASWLSEGFHNLTQAPGNIVSGIENIFVRSGLIIFGGIVVFISLWYLLSDVTDVPSPSDTAALVFDAAKSAAKSAAMAA